MSEFLIPLIPTYSSRLVACDTFYTSHSGRSGRLALISFLSECDELIASIPFRLRCMGGT